MNTHETFLFKFSEIYISKVPLKTLYDTIHMTNICIENPEGFLTAVYKKDANSASTTMTPEISFTIPSVHDSVPLDCRIYHPTGELSTTSNVEEILRLRGAIIAHPYTSFGGSYDDFVVLSTVAEVLKLGFVAGTFNFRYP